MVKATGAEVAGTLVSGGFVGAAKLAKTKMIFKH